MGWLEGLLSGYADQHLEVEKENIRKAENAAREEGEIYKLLLNSPDKAIRAKAATGIMQLGKPASRKGGFRGWLGQMETSPMYPELLDYASTKHWYEDPADPVMRPPTAAPGQPQITTPPAATGSAAMPATPAQTEPGAKPMTPVQQGPPQPPFLPPNSPTWPTGQELFSSNLKPTPAAGAPAAAAGAAPGAPGAVPAAAGPPPPPVPGVTAPPTQPTTPPASLAPPPPPPQRTTFEPRPPQTKSVFRYPNVFPTAADLAGEKEEAEVSGTIRGWQRMFKEDGDPDWQRKGIEAAMAQKRSGSLAAQRSTPVQLEYEDANGKTITTMGWGDPLTRQYFDSQNMPIVGTNIRRARPSIDYGDNTEAASAILFKGARFSDLTDPRQRALAIDYANVMKQKQAYYAATGTNNAAFEKQLDALASQATQLPVGTRSSDLVPGATPNPAPPGGRTEEQIRTEAANIPAATPGPVTTPAPGAGPAAVTPAPGATPQPQQPPMSQVPQRPGGVTVPRVQTDYQTNSVKYFGRAEDALRRLEELTDPKDPDYGSLEDRYSEMGIFGQGQSQLPDALNFAKTQDQQQYRAMQRAFTEARLRQESGAAVPPHEYINDERTYFAVPGNSPETIAMKREMRKQVLDGMAFAAGPAYRARYGADYQPRGRQPEGTQSPHFQLGADPPVERNPDGSIIYLPDGSAKLKLTQQGRYQTVTPQSAPPPAAVVAPTAAPTPAPVAGPPPAPPGEAMSRVPVPPLDLAAAPPRPPGFPNQGPILAPLKPGQTQPQLATPPALSQRPGTITLDTEMKKLKVVNGKMVKVE